MQPPANGMVEIGGPEKFKMFEIVRRALEANADEREVVGDPNATYFGAPLDDKSLVADDGCLIGPTRYEKWQSRGAAAPLRSKELDFRNDCTERSQRARP